MSEANKVGFTNPTLLASKKITYLHHPVLDMESQGFDTSTFTRAIASLVRGEVAVIKDAIICTELF